MQRLSTRDFHRHPGIGDFDCGNPSLDGYLRTLAGQQHRRDVSRVYLVEDAGSGALVGVLIGRLVVDRRYQGLGIGSAVLYDAFRACTGIADRTGAPVVLVDAIDAAAFYQRHGFERSHADSRQLFMLMPDVRKTVGTLR